MFIFLDTETTGTEEDDRLCQLAYKTDNGREKCNKLFNPEKKISIEAMSVHHITNEMVADKPTFKKSNEAKKIKALFESPNNHLVAHNAKFDVEMLQKEGISPRNVICTLKLARYLDKEGYFKKYNLQYLRYAMKISVIAKAHDAWGDIWFWKKYFKGYFKKSLKRMMAIKNRLLK